MQTILPPWNRKAETAAARLPLKERQRNRQSQKLQRRQIPKRSPQTEEVKVSR